MEEELPLLQSTLKDDEPAYILARLDEAGSGWLAISYVPDTASVRSKVRQNRHYSLKYSTESLLSFQMLYASTRSSLTKSLGSAHFSDTLFATSKEDLTPESYAAHLKHMAAPKPLSARERELEEAREAERKAENYQANRAPQQLHGETPGLSWADEAKDAVVKLGKDSEDRLLILVCYEFFVSHFLNFNNLGIVLRLSTRPKLLLLHLRNSAKLVMLLVRSQALTPVSDPSIASC